MFWFMNTLRKEMSVCDWAINFWDDDALPTIRKKDIDFTQHHTHAHTHTSINPGMSKLQQFYSKQCSNFVVRVPMQTHSNLNSVWLNWNRNENEMN